MSYDAFRHFADSWGLLFMAILYLTFVGWAFLPRNRERNRDAANMIFKDSDHGRIRGFQNRIRHRRTHAAGGV